MAKIGFIGLGHMGLPMANCLLKANHQVTGYDLQPESLVALQQAGGKTVHTIQELASDQDIFITMLQTGEQVRQVCLGEDGLFNSAPRDSLYIDCSTVDVQSARDIQHEAQAYGIKSLEAPVSGGVAGAEAGRLTFMVAGDESYVSLVQPILAAMGQTILYTGPAGSGQAAKICNNMILGISMIAISEAFILAERLGLSAKKLHEIVTHASGQCWAMSNYVPVPGVLPGVPANHGYQPGFSVAMMLKDLKLSQDAAEHTDVHTPMGNLALKLYQEYNTQETEMLDFSGIINYLSFGDP